MIGEYWTALWPFWSSRLRAIYFWLTFVVGAVLTALPGLGIASLPGSPIPGIGVMAIAAVFSFVSANIALFSSLSQELANLRTMARNQPELAIEFADTAPFGYWHQEQLWCYRVRVKNNGPAPAHGCRVVIREAQNQNLIGSALHWTHRVPDNLEDPITIPAGSEALADVVTSFGDSPVVRWQVVDGQYGFQIPAPSGWEYKFTLRAEAENATHHPEQSFVLYADGDQYVDVRIKTAR